MHNKKGENNNSGDHIPRKSRGFIFEDYETPKYEYKQQSRFSEVKLSLNRVSFIFFIFLVVAFVFGSKIIYLASIKKEKYFPISIFFFILSFYIFGKIILKLINNFPLSVMN